MIRRSSAVGLKWAFLQNDALQLHSALGIGYEFASGGGEVLNDDDDVFGHRWTFSAVIEF